MLIESIVIEGLGKLFFNLNHTKIHNCIGELCCSLLKKSTFCGNDKCSKAPNYKDKPNGTRLANRVAVRAYLHFITVFLNRKLGRKKAFVRHTTKPIINLSSIA